MPCQYDHAGVIQIHGDIQIHLNTLHATHATRSTIAGVNRDGVNTTAVAAAVEAYNSIHVKTDAE